MNEHTESLEKLMEIAPSKSVARRWAIQYSEVINDNYPKIPPQHLPRFHDLVDKLVRKCANLHPDEVDDLLLRLDDFLERFGA